MEIQESEISRLASKYINNTGRHIFLTGRAGTGKTTFLKELLKYTLKKNIVVAPTGVAAINASGVTIHSQFQLPFSCFVPDNGFMIDEELIGRVNTPKTLLNNFQMNRSKRKILKDIELLIIDEVSMVRSDILDSIDTILRSVRRNPNVPFGGLQVLFIGDLLQLQPVIRPHEWQILEPYYQNIYFFSAKVLQNDAPIYIELDKIYRQSDKTFISILNNLRSNKLTEEDRQILNSYVSDETNYFQDQNYIFLTTHNRKANTINNNKLNSLNTSSFTFKAIVKDDFPDSMYPIESEIVLKEETQVMFVKNDYSGENRYFNGKIGKITRITKDEIIVGFDDESQEVEVEYFTWENKKYSLNPTNGEIEDDIKGSFTQIPLRLAWAITIHKSQGLTFQKAIIDLSDTFAPGQMYVALSRLTGLDGLVLANPIPSLNLNIDKNIINFHETKSEIKDLDNEFINECYLFLLTSTERGFNFEEEGSEFQKFIYSFNKDEKKSLKQQDLAWAKNLFKNFQDLKKVSLSFKNQINRIINLKNFKTVLPQRTQAAQGYFLPLLKDILKHLKQKIEDLKNKKGVKEYVKELIDLSNLFEIKINTIQKTVSIIEAAAKDQTILRSEAKKPVRAVKSNRYKAKNSSTNKIPTHAISFELYKQGKSIEEIAKKRGLVKGTIEGHVIKWLREDWVSYDSFLCEEDAADIIETAIQLDTEDFKTLREHYNNRFSYFQLRVAMHVQEHGA